MGMDFGDLGRGRPWSCGCRRTISPGIETARDLAVARPTKGGRPRPPQGNLDPPRLQGGGWERTDLGRRSVEVPSLHLKVVLQRHLGRMPQPAAVVLDLDAHPGQFRGSS